jgi:N-acetylmuramoyl-L-alanine amidase
MMSVDPITRLIVHHSASPTTTTVEQIRRWHVEDRGWADIGYHFVVMKGGTIAKGRPLPYTGAHAQGHNFDTLGVCLVGDNTKPGQGWTPAQVESLHRIWHAAQVIFPGIDIFGHRDVASGTECPGLDVRALVLGPNAKPVKAAA